MSTDAEPPPETVTLTVKLSFSGRPMEAELAVPTRPFPLRDLLPTFRSLSEAIVGRAVSCRSGCGACYRQLVPVSEVEARLIPAADGPRPRLAAAPAGRAARGGRLSGS